MKLTIFNGSPRGKNGNSGMIINWLLEGMKAGKGFEHEILYLNNTQKHHEYAQSLAAAEYAIIIFPLYTDSMPGIVMAFIEALEQIKKPLSGLKLGYIIHSGFPEAAQSRSIERYVVKLTELLGAQYIGTAIMPGSEGMKIMPEAMTRKKRELFGQLGERLLAEGSFDRATVGRLAGKEKMSDFGLAVYMIISKTSLTNFYWDNQLKANNAYDKRFDRPYA